MEMTKKTESLMKAYVKEASFYLPLSKREERQRELSSDLWDQLDEKYPSGNCSEEEMKDFLKEQGSPIGKSRIYGEDHGLIGPEIMPLFQLITTIVFAVLTVVSFFGFFLQEKALIPYLGQFVSMLLAAFGGIVLAFAIMDRLVPSKEWDKMDDEWDPKQLDTSDEDSHGWAESIATWFFSVLFIVLFLEFKDKFGIWYRQDESWKFLSVLTPAFFNLIPFWIAGLILDSFTEILIRLKMGWNPISRISDLLRSLLDMGITFYILLQGWSYIFIEGTLAGSELNTLQMFANWGQKLFIPLMILALFGTLVETIKKGAALLKS